MTINGTLFGSSPESSAVTTLSPQVLRVYNAGAATTFSSAMGSTHMAELSTYPKMGIFLSCKHDTAAMVSDAVGAGVWLTIRTVLAGFPDDGRPCFYTDQHEPEANPQAFASVGGDKGQTNFKIAMGKLRQVADLVNASRTTPVQVGPVLVSFDAESGSNFFPASSWVSGINPKPHFIGPDQYGQTTAALNEYDAWDAAAVAMGVPLAVPEMGNHPDASTTQSTDAQMLAYMKAAVAKMASLTSNVICAIMHPEGVNDLGNKPNSTAYWQQLSFTSGLGFGAVLAVTVGFAADMTIPNQITQIKRPVSATPTPGNSISPNIACPTLAFNMVGFLSVAFTGPSTNMVTPFAGWTLLGTTSTSAYTQQTYMKNLVPGDSGSTFTATMDATHKWDCVLECYQGASSTLANHTYSGAAETVSGSAHTVPTYSVTRDATWAYEVFSDRGAPGSTVFTPDGSEVLRSFVANTGTGAISLGSSDVDGGLAIGTYAGDVVTGDLATVQAITAVILIASSLQDLRVGANQMSATVGFSGSMQALQGPVAANILGVSVTRLAAMTSNQQMAALILAASVARDVDMDKAGTGGGLTHLSDSPADIAANSTSPQFTMPTIAAGQAIIAAVSFSGADSAMTADLADSTGAFTLLGTISKGTTFTVRVYARIAGNGETGTTASATLSSQVKWSIVYSVYSGTDLTLADWVFSGAAESSSTTNHTAPNINGIATASWAWTFGADRGSSGSTTMSPLGGYATKRAQSANTGAGAVTLACGDSAGAVGAVVTGSQVWQGTLTTATAVTGTVVIPTGTSSSAVDGRGPRAQTVTFAGAMASNQGMAAPQVPVTAGLTASMVPNYSIGQPLNVDVGIVGALSVNVVFPATTRLVTASFQGAMAITNPSVTMAANVMAATVSRAGSMVRGPALIAPLPVSVGLPGEMVLTKARFRLRFDGAAASSDDHDRPTNDNPRNAGAALWRRTAPVPSQRALLLYRNGTVTVTSSLYGRTALAADYVVAAGHVYEGDRDDWQTQVLLAAGYTLEVVT